MSQQLMAFACLNFPCFTRFRTFCDRFCTEFCTRKRVLDFGYRIRKSLVTLLTMDWLTPPIPTKRMEARHCRVWGLKLGSVLMNPLISPPLSESESQCLGIASVRARAARFLPDWASALSDSELHFFLLDLELNCPGGGEVVEPEQKEVLMWIAERRSPEELARQATSNGILKKPSKLRHLIAQENDHCSTLSG